jgi:hypothetical protein
MGAEEENNHENINILKLNINIKKKYLYKKRGK